MKRQTVYRMPSRSPLVLEVIYLIRIRNVGSWTIRSVIVYSSVVDGWCNTGILCLLKHISTEIVLQVVVLDLVQTRTHRGYLDSFCGLIVNQ